MLVYCPQCQAKYELDVNQFAGRQEVQIRCSKCRGTFAVRKPATEMPSTAKVGEATVASKAGGSLPEGKSVSLVVTQGPLKGKVFPVGKPRLVLGRFGTDLVLDDPEVSRQHCAIEMHGATGLLVDLGSSNGTFVNNEKVKSQELEHLSEFRIGSNTFMLTITAK